MTTYLWEDKWVFLLVQVHYRRRDVIAGVDWSIMSVTESQEGELANIRIKWSNNAYAH